MRSVAALLLCLLVMTITADPVVCPDGCTDEAPTSPTSRQTRPPCALCMGWSQIAIVVPARPGPRAVAPQVLVTTAPTDPDLPDIDRPPRLE